MKEYIMPINDTAIDWDEMFVCVIRKQEELIRCKDCKWCAEYYDVDLSVPYWVCDNWDGQTDADGYCHEAERKEE